MFRMIIEGQLNIKDRTLIGGIGEYDKIPKMIKIDDKKYQVIGVTSGIMRPKISLEIERTEEKLKEKTVTAYYEYNIFNEYSRDSFFNTVNLIIEKFDFVDETKYIEDSLDGDQIQIIKTPEGQVKVINDFMVGAVWVESEVSLDSIFKEL